MKATEPTQILLKDYKAPDFTITHVNLTFWLGKKETVVESHLSLKRLNPKSSSVFLNGEELELMSIELNGQELKSSDYELDKLGLTLSGLEDENIIKIKNRIRPDQNKALDGLYVSGDILCTQNEPEGFRRITYFIDRPDVMAIYTTTIIGDEKEFPVMLANGNLTEQGLLDDGKHFCVWNDPHQKPSYLYALVAGDLALVQDSFRTQSGRDVDLRIYVDKGNENKCDHAMISLKKSMQWDEERFGLEYDLDIYMIVAVDSFNMGAMENKGLNIFNSAYVLARPETATDDNFHGIESVIGHEYFHNWTGNRITCRDWFQLTLKEGLTVYRDQEFSADLNSRPVERVKMVQSLRNRQFVEDSGPTAHPIKPKTYLQINNFYSATVYEKGAEVIRMIATMLGQDGFRRGMDKYFELFDGMAVTTEDFLHAMSVANQDFDLTQFKLWYDQAGTPTLDIEFQQNLKDQTVTLTIKQSCAPTPGQLEKKPFHMPLLMGLVDDEGLECPLELQNRKDQPDLHRGLLHLKKAEEVFIFEKVDRKVTPALNRDFSAPVNINSNLTAEQRLLLATKDSDAFLRYEMTQELYHTEVQSVMKQLLETEQPILGDGICQVVHSILQDQSLDPMMKSLLLTLPEESVIHQRQQPIDIEMTYAARCFIEQALGEKFRSLMIEEYQALHEKGAFKQDGLSIGKRAYKNSLLDFLAPHHEDHQTIHDLILGQFKHSNNMTDQLAALKAIVHHDFIESKSMLHDFYDQWKHDTLVMQKWLSLQAAHPGDQTYSEVVQLESNSVYDKTVPNCVRALWRNFAANHVQFHHPTGRGYILMSERIAEIDKFNPHIAAGLAGAFKLKPRLKKESQQLIEKALRPLVSLEGLSNNTYEVISKTLS
jgi:aminopeptidase N